MAVFPFNSGLLEANLQKCLGDMFSIVVTQGEVYMDQPCNRKVSHLPFCPRQVICKVLMQKTKHRRLTSQLVVPLMVQKSGDHQLRLVVYPIIYRVSYIPGGAGFLRSTVLLKFFGG